MTVAELIAILQTFNQNAKMVAPFSPNASDINVEEVGGAFPREYGPFLGAIELSRSRPVHTEPSRSQSDEAPRKPEAVSDDALAMIRNADSDAPV